MTEAEMRETVRRKVAEAGSQREFARRVGVSVPFVNDVIHGRRNVGPTIAGYLGFTASVQYVRVAEYRKQAQR